MNRKRITKKATLALVAMMTVTSVVGCSQSNNSSKNINIIDVLCQSI